MKDRNWAVGDRFTWISWKGAVGYGTVTYIRGSVVFGVIDGWPEEEEIHFHRLSPYVVKGEV